MKNQELELTIEKIVPNGFGLAFADGLTIFVSLAAAGDKLRVKIRETKGKVAFAEIVDILEPSPDRITPRCRHFGRCGGCDFQQLNYQAQLDAKVAIIRDCLRRIGKIDFPAEIPIIAGQNDFEYRSRAQWHVDTRNRRIGYFKRHSHQVIDAEECPILIKPLQDKLAALRESLPWDEFRAEHVEIETASDGKAISVYSSEILEPTESVAFEVNSFTYRHDAETFFQGNLSLVGDLIRAAIAGATGTAALDLYCGVGLFSLALANAFDSVTGVEGNERSIDFARENLEHSRLENVKFFAEDTSEWLAENSEKFDFVLLDPPRSGAEPAVINAILKLAPKNISYVSCDPATLARDLRLLSEKYKIESITAIDLFPQTHHVETVVRLFRLNL